MQKQPGYESDLFRLAISTAAPATSRVGLQSLFRNWVDAFQWASDSKISTTSDAPVEGELIPSSPRDSRLRFHIQQSVAGPRDRLVLVNSEQHRIV